MEAGATALALLLICAPTWALDIHHANATYADRHYQFELSATLDAPLARIETVLRDYDRYPSLDARILEAQVLERTPEAVVLQTTLRMCFGPFCRNVKRVEWVQEAEGQLHAASDPQRSDVKSCETRTILMSVGGQTQLSYRTDIEPDFWIPPVIGRRWMLNTLRDASIELFRHVESRAQRDGFMDEQTQAPVSEAPLTVPQ